MTHPIFCSQKCCSQTWPEINEVAFSKWSELRTLKGIKVTWITGHSPLEMLALGDPETPGVAT